MLEVLTLVAVVGMSLVYRETYSFTPLLLKTNLTVFTWFNVKNIYRNSFGTFYTKNLKDAFY